MNSMRQLLHVKSDPTVLNSLRPDIARVGYESGRVWSSQIDCMGQIWSD